MGGHGGWTRILSGWIEYCSYKKQWKSFLNGIWEALSIFPVNVSLGGVGKPSSTILDIALGILSCLVPFFLDKFYASCTYGLDD